MTTSQNDIRDSSSSPCANPQLSAYLQCPFSQWRQSDVLSIVVLRPINGLVSTFLAPSCPASCPGSCPAACRPACATRGVPAFMLSAYAISTVWPSIAQEPLAGVVWPLTPQPSWRASALPFAEAGGGGVGWVVGALPLVGGRWREGEVYQGD